MNSQTNPLNSAPPPPPPGYGPVSVVPPPPPGYGPVSIAGGGSAAPGASAPPQGNPLTDNPNGEGIYRMKGPDGKEAGIPYSKAKGAAKQAGYNFADDGEYQRFMKDYLQDPEVKSGMVERAKDDPGLGMFLGFARHLAKTALGLYDIGNKVDPGEAASRALMPQKTNEDERKFGAALKPVRQFANDPDVETGSSIGGGLEDTAEFVLGDHGLTKLGAMLGFVPKLAEAAKIEQEIQKGTPLGKLALNALRQGGVAGAQTYVKTGGDAGAAAGSGLATGVLSGAIEGAGAGASSLIRKNMTTLEDVGGVQTPVSAEVRNARPTPQQTAGQQSIKNSAQDALRRNLEEANESRRVPANAPALPAKTGPYQFEIKGTPTAETTEGDLTQRAGKFEPTASQVPKGQEPGPQNKAELGSQAATIPDRLLKRTQAFTSATPAEGAADVASGGGTLRTQDPNVVREHIGKLNEAIGSENFKSLPAARQQELLAARADAQRQMGEYWEQMKQTFPNHGRPNFEQINIPEKVKQVGNWTQAADALEKTATDGYEHFNYITGDKFDAIRQANKDAWAAYKGASGLPAKQAAEKAVDETNRQMAELMDSIHGAVSPKELSGFNEAYRNVQTMRQVANAVDSTFSGNASSAARSWEYRGFDGSRLMSNLSRIQQKVGRGPLERVIGKDNLNTLFQVAELNRTGAARARFGAAIQPIVKHLIGLHVGPLAAGGFLGHVSGIGYEAGAAGGWITAQATKKVMDAVLTNPKIAQNLLFAIDAGANPENYGPMIATMIQQQETESSRQQQQQEQNEGNGEQQ